MTRLGVSLLFVAIALAGCGGSTPAASGGGGATGGNGGGATPAATPAISEPVVSAKPGKPVVTVDGKKVHVEGVGVGISDKFDLTGNYAMTITPCKATGVTPFIVLRSAATNLAPTYVDQVTHLTKLSGKYDVEINPDPSCSWAVEFAPE